MSNGVYVIAPDTPTKTRPGGSENAQTKSTVPQKRKPANNVKTNAGNAVYHVPNKSNFISSLADLAKSQSASSSSAKTLVARSVAFNQPAPSSVRSVEPTRPLRDQSLAIIEELKIGPYNHVPPPDDLNFNHLEPHSKIRLSSREMAHEEFSDMLRGRYYISPSTLYSVARPQNGRTGYDVPVDSDWVTIGVIAERGPIKTTGSRPSAMDDEAPRKSVGKSKNNNKVEDNENDEAHNDNGKITQSHSVRKYVNFKLVDFGTRESSGANAQVRGDAQLSLLLFESDSYSVQEIAATGEKTRVYRGGSRGAFEALGQYREGAVIALLNPRILKPMDNQPVHRKTNLLGITPESKESIVLLGYSQDLGMCTARRLDGRSCGSWVDKRSSDVCDYHLQRAVKSRQGSRPEFTAGTSAMTTFEGRAQKAKQPEYDPKRKWGLKPEPKNANGSSVGHETYIFGGRVVSAVAPPLEFAHEKMGRERDTRQARKRADESLNALLERDIPSSDTMRAALKQVGRYKPLELSAEQQKKADEAKDEQERRARKVFSAEKVKAMGFDPLLRIAKTKVKSVEDGESSRMAARLTANCATRAISLSRRPGEKIRSGIVKPATADLTTDEDDLIIESSASNTVASVHVRLPSSGEASDDDLEAKGRPSKIRRVSSVHSCDHPATRQDYEPLDFPESDEDME